MKIKETVIDAIGMYLCLATSVFLIYLVGAYINLSFDVQDWEAIDRFLHAVISPFLAVGFWKELNHAR